MKRGYFVWMGLAALLLAILACGPRGDETPEAAEDEPPPAQEETEEPPREVVESPPDVEEEPLPPAVEEPPEEEAPPPPPEEPPAADTVDIAEQLEWSGGGGDGVSFVCPDYASGAKPSVIFGRDRAPYDFSRLCLYDLTLLPDTDLTLTLISPLGTVTSAVYAIGGSLDSGLTAAPVEDNIFRLQISETRYDTYQAEVAVFMPPSQGDGEWVLELDDNVSVTLTLPLVVPPYSHEALLVVPQSSTIFYTPPCCQTGEPVRYEGAGFMPNHLFVLGGFLLPIDAPYTGTRLFQAEVFTDSTGVFAIEGVAPATDESGKFCLVLLDPETETVILEDIFMGSLCRTLDP